MTISREHGRRVFALQVAGLEYRFHSTTPPSSTNLDSTVATTINYVDREGIISVGAFSASIDPSGGVGQYSPLSVTLQIDKRANSGNPGVIFGRCGIRSATTKAQLTESINRSDVIIKVDTDLTSLSYPRLMHIGGETLRIASAISTRIFATSGRGVGGTTPQSHSIDLEGSIVPEVTTEITTFRGRKAKLFGAHQYPDGSVSDYVEVMNGFIEQSPTIEEGDTISLSIVPLTALIDTDLTDKINQTRLLQGYHYFDGRYGSVLEYALALNVDEYNNPPILTTDTTASITASLFQTTVETNRGYENLLDDFDTSLAAGAAKDDFIHEHPRYPRLRRSQDDRLENDSVYATTTTYNSSLPGYVINADSSPSDALTAGEITATDQFIINLPRHEIKRHSLGSAEVKQWPNVINDTLETSGPSNTQGASGGFARWRINADNIIRVSKLSASPFAAELQLWTHSYQFKARQRVLVESGNARACRHWSASGTDLALDDLSRLSYPIDIAGETSTNPNEYYDSPRGAGQFALITSNNRRVNASYQLRDIAKAYYQLYESVILVENSLGLPTSATANINYDVIIMYYDRSSETTKRQTFKVTHETTATFDGSDVGILLHVDDQSDFPQLVSFADWTDSERVLIFRGSSFIEERPGQALLKLLESGGGDQINGTYDTLGLGLNINSTDIDEESFLAMDTACPFLLSDQFAGDGSDLKGIFDNLLKLMGAVLVMKRDSSTGKSRISLQPVGSERAADASATILAGDWLTDPAPHWDIYEDIVTQIKYEFDYSPEEDSYLSEVIFNNQEAINRYGGESSKITLTLPGVSSEQFGRNAGDNFSYFLPSSDRLFNLLSNPLRAWRGSIGTGPSAFLDVGSYVKVSSPHLRGYSDSYGVVDGVGMIRAINQELMSEGCELEILTTGLSPVAWNATAQVASILTSSTVTVSEDDFSGSSVDDVSFFQAGDVVDYLPLGDHDNAITNLTIQSISTNTITFTGAHGISASGGTLESTTYANASATHRLDAYLANVSNVINSNVTAQEFS